MMAGNKLNGWQYDMTSDEFKLDMYIHQLNSSIKFLEVAYSIKGSCQVFELDYPLVTDVSLPKGFKLKDDWLFSTGNGYFQLAIGEDLEDEASYMFTEVYGEIKALTDEGMYQITFNHA